MTRKSRSLVLAALLSLTVSLVVVPLWPGSSTPAEATTDDFSITTHAALDPAFNPAVPDYAVRCAGSPTTQVTTAGTGSVTIAGATFPGPVTLNAPLVAGQELQISHGAMTYYVRCLPADFPNYSASVTGRPQQANGYMLNIGRYSIVFDTNGVPVWWDTGVSSPPTGEPDFAEFIDPSTIAWGQSDGSFQLVGLNGKVNGVVGGGATSLDTHDFELLPNGNYLGIERVTRDCPSIASQCVDLSSWGLSSESTIIDDDIVELTPKGQAVWRWSVADHIDVATANVNWHDQFPDVIHMNSIEYDGRGGIIFSARHLDAVYRIDMATGAITWKLGGSITPRSLTVIGDSHAELFSGQHDARIAPDGSLTVYDDGTNANRPPRALRFVINTVAHTATEVEQVTDPQAQTSICCGSAEKLAGGNWVISWGYDDFMTELSPQGIPQITISYPGNFSYRASDVPASVTSLRAGMDEMVPPLNVSMGYWLVASDGGVFSYGDARFYGSTGNQTLNKPVVGMAATPDGGGYWLVASDGGVFSYGDARFYGSTGNQTLNKPVVGMAATPDGGGYWLVASDGGLFSYGDARFYGSTGNQTLNKPVVGMAATPDGGGYWLVASDGGLFSYGDARFYGSTGNQTLNKPVVGMAATPDGGGYWLVASDGGLFSYGDARFYGSTGNQTLNKPVVGMAATPDGGGYWLVASDGGLFSYGDARFYGSTGNRTLNEPVVAMASTWSFN